MLKYFFTARYQDGTSYSQNVEDLSLINLEKSSFYDVLQKNETSPIERFSLTDNNNHYLVDLRDGHFEINGASFNLHNTELSYSNKRLIYFRRNTLSFTQGLGFIGQGVCYKLGWQGNDIHGNNVQYIIEFY